MGGEGGDAHAVRVINNGALSTFGARAQGLSAQSIGGGGGEGGMSLTGEVADGGRRASP